MTYEQLSLKSASADEVGLGLYFRRTSSLHSLLGAADESACIPTTACLLPLLDGATELEFR